MIENKNPLADGPREIGIVRAMNGLLVLWRTSTWGLPGGVTFDGRTMMASPDTAKIAVREMMPPTGCDHYFDPTKFRVVRVGAIEGPMHQCGCGCGLVMVHDGQGVRFWENEAKLREGGSSS